MPKEELNRLSQYLKGVIDRHGLNAKSFFEKFGYEDYLVDGRRKPIIGSTVFSGLVGRREAMPSPNTMHGLSRILTKAAIALDGEDAADVTYVFLNSLLNEHRPHLQYEEDPDAIDLIDTSEMSANTIARKFEGLPYKARQLAAVEILKTISEDVEYSGLTDAERVAWLCRRDVRLAGRGTETFAKEFVGIDPAKFKAIAEGRPVKLSKAELIMLAAKIRDIDGKTAINSTAVSSLFAKVLLPDLYRPVEDSSDVS